MFWFFNNKTKKIKGPRSGVCIEIFAIGTSREQDEIVNLFDYLGVIGKTLVPDVLFRLHQVDGDTYTIGKVDIYICMRDVKYDINTLVYVFLHELAHVSAKDSSQHDKAFMSNFQELLEEAKRFGFYRVKYEIKPKLFCGKMITQ